MSVQELSRSVRREPLQLTSEQEARHGVLTLVQQLLDLQIRESFTTPDVYVMHGAAQDTRTDEEKKRTPFLPRFETYAQDRLGIVSLHFEETPISLYLNIGNALYPAREDSIRVEFERKGVNQGYTMVEGPTLADGSPAPAETALILIGEGQTLVDLIKQA